MYADLSQAPPLRPVPSAQNAFNQALIAALPVAAAHNLPGKFPTDRQRVEAIAAEANALAQALAAYFK